MDNVTKIAIAFIILLVASLFSIIAYTTRERPAEIFDVQGDVIVYRKPDTRSGQWVYYTNKGNVLQNR